MLDGKAKFTEETPVIKKKPKKKDSFKSDSDINETEENEEYENFEHNFATEIDPTLERNEEYVEKLGVLLL